MDSATLFVAVGTAAYGLYLAHAIVRAVLRIRRTRREFGEVEWPIIEAELYQRASRKNYRLREPRSAGPVLEAETVSVELV